MSMDHPVDARIVANALIYYSNNTEHKNCECKSPLEPLQIIKLVYICHGWMLGIHKRPLIKQPVQACKYGPMIKEVYDSLWEYGGCNVYDLIEGYSYDVDELEKDIILQVKEKYGYLSSIELSSLTHAEGTPWHSVWNKNNPPPSLLYSMLGKYFVQKNKKDIIIPNELIEEYYSNLYNKRAIKLVYSAN